jgi:hypothetical protein
MIDYLALAAPLIWIGKRCFYELGQIRRLALSQVKEIMR